MEKREPSDTTGTCVCFSRVRLFANPWTVACQAPLSMRFSRQEYWSGLSCPHPGHLPHPGTERATLWFPALAGGFFTTSFTSHTLKGAFLPFRAILPMATRGHMRDIAQSVLAARPVQETPPGLPAEPVPRPPSEKASCVQERR